MKRRLFTLLCSFISMMPLLLKAWNHPAEIVNYSVSCMVKEGKLISEYEMLVQVNNRAGEQFADISIAVDGTEKLKGLVVTLTDTLGRTIRELSDNEIQISSRYENIQYYSDQKLIRFSALWSSCPYRFHFKYRVEQKEFLSVVDWNPFALNGVHKVREARLSVNCPTDYALRFLQQNVSIAAENTLDKMNTKQWLVHGLERGQNGNGDYRAEDLPKVVVVPLHFRFGAEGSWSDWSSYAKYIRAMNSSAFDLPREEQKKIQELCNGISDPLKKIEKAFDYLREHTRYVNITFGTGGIKPWPASWTSRNKYGDCKALTVYFLSLLKALDINGDYALIRIGASSNSVDTNFPSQQFNHVIARIPLPDTVVWVDATSPFPLGHLPVPDRNRPTFVVGGDWSGFKSTPKLDDALSLRNAVVHFEFDSNKTLEAHARIIFSGIEYERAFMIRYRGGDDRKHRFAEKLYPLKGFNLIDWRMPYGGFDTCSEKVMESRYQSSAVSLDGKHFLAMLVPRVFIEDLEDFADRPNSFQVDYPLVYNDTIVFHIPDDYAAGQIPDSADIAGSGFQYRRRVVIHEKTVTIIRSFKLDCQAWKPAQRDELKFLLDKMKNLDKNGLVVISKKI